MKATSKQTVEVTLTLNLDEAKQLMGVVQNYHGDPANERPDHERIREQVFTILKAEVDKVSGGVRKAGP